MNKKYLIINTGSTSKKYSFYEGENKLYTAHFEEEGMGFVVTEKINDDSIKTNISAEEYRLAIGFVVDSLISNKIIKQREEIDLSGIRIVAPGEYF